MRIFFPNSTRPKRASKHIAMTLGVLLSAAQQAVARSCGYRDWHELEKSCGKGSPSQLDHALSLDDFVARQAQMALSLATVLSISSGDAQYALSEARLSGDRPVGLNEQIAIRLAIWRATSLPPRGARQCGALGRLKTPGRNGEAVILRLFGRPTEVISHRGASTVADFEYISPRAELPLFMPMRLYLPYGYWVEEGGVRVIFNRDYKPMWRILVDGTVQRLEPWLWIKFMRQVFLWDDACTPWHSSDLKCHLEDLLSGWGIRALPLIADALPLLVNATPGREVGFSDAADLLKLEREQRHPPAAA